MKNELVGLLCHKYYEFPASSGASAGPIPGQIVSAHCIYPTDDPWILKVINYDASDPSRTQFELKRFDEHDRSHFPVAELNLRKDENLYVYKGKERPLVVLGAVKSRWANALYDECSFLCIPLFSFKQKHSEIFRIECAAFFHPTLMYLPAEPDGCSAEGVLRFEHMQPIARKALHNYLAGTPSRATSLTNEAFSLLLNHLGRFLFRRDYDQVVCDQIDAYRELVREELDKIRDK
jgi:hypothetical protein